MSITPTAGRDARTGRSLRHHRANKKTTVRSAANRRGSALTCTSRNQVFAGRDEVVEDVLLLLEHPRLVPALAVFAPPRMFASAYDAALFHPRDHAGAETWDGT
jgi:hypothetical protein